MEFCCGPHNSTNHPAKSEGGRPSTGPFDSRGRKVDIRWSTYVLDDVPLFFFAWVGPHGSLELPAIIFSAAAGLVAGRAFLMPGNLSRAASLRRVLPSVWRMMIGTALTLVCAGIVEGSFSQFSSRVFPYPLKIAVAILLFTGLLAYLFLRGMAEEA